MAKFPKPRHIKVIHKGLSVPAVHNRRLTIKAPVGVFEWHDGGALLQGERLVGLGPGATARQKDRQRQIQKRIDRLAVHVCILIDDLSRGMTCDRVQAFGVIVLPLFETKDTRVRAERKIRTMTMR